MIEILKDVIAPLLSNPEFLEVRKVDSVKGNKYLVMVEENDYQRVVGKNGQVIHAIKSVASLHDKHSDIQVEVY